MVHFQGILSPYLSCSWQTEGAGGRVNQRSHVWDEEEEARARQTATNLNILEKKLEEYRERIK